MLIQIKAPRGYLLSSVHSQAEFSPQRRTVRERTYQQNQASSLVFLRLCGEFIPFMDGNQRVQVAGVGQRTGL
jgi:hypothetical protein